MPSKSKPLIPATAPPPTDTAAFDSAVAAEVRRQLAALGVQVEPKPFDLPPDLKHNRLVGAEPAAAMLGYSVAHFRRLYRAGKIPAPVKINGRKVGWPASVLQNLVTSRQSAA